MKDLISRMSEAVATKDTAWRDRFTTDEYRRLLEAHKVMRDSVIKSEEMFKDIESNWDHDEDAHRYNSACRVCLAKHAADACTKALTRVSEILGNE